MHSNSMDLSLHSLFPHLVSAAEENPHSLINQWDTFAKNFREEPLKKMAALDL